MPSPSASEDRVNILDTLIKAVAMTAPTSAIHEAVLEWIARCREEVNRGERARDCLNRLEEARLKIERRAVYNLGMNMAEHQKHLREQVLQQLEEEQNKDCNRSRDEGIATAVRQHLALLAADYRREAADRRNDFARSFLALDEPTKVETMPDPMSYKLEKVARFFDLLVKLVDLI